MQTVFIWLNTFFKKQIRTYYNHLFYIFIHTAQLRQLHLQHIDKAHRT